MSREIWFSDDVPPIQYDPNGRWRKFVRRAWCLLFIMFGLFFLCLIGVAANK